MEESPLQPEDSPIPLCKAIVYSRSWVRKLVNSSRLASLTSAICCVFFLFFFYNCIVPMGFLPWEIRVAFPGESHLQQSRVTQPRVHAGCFECFQTPPNSDMDHGIFNVRTVVNACDCARGCTDTVRESAIKVDSWRKIPRRTGESNLSRRRAGPML